MTGEEADPVVPFCERRRETRRRAVAPDEAVTVGVGFLRPPQVDDQLSGFVRVLHTEIVDL
jgi:hypothetical protein